MFKTARVSISASCVHADRGCGIFCLRPLLALAATAFSPLLFLCWLALHLPSHGSLLCTCICCSQHSRHPFLRLGYRLEHRLEWRGGDIVGASPHVSPHTFVGAFDECVPRADPVVNPAVKPLGADWLWGSGGNPVRLLIGCGGASTCGEWAGSVRA